MFTNGVEWVGEGFGLSEGAVGSVLAAVGTALPETLLPIIAIVSGHDAGQDIGVGAILGAPFMLTTLAMVVVAVAVFIFGRGGRRPLQLDIDRGVIRQDLGYFLVMYSLAVVAGLLHSKPFDYALVIVLMVGYVYYVRRHFQTEAQPRGRRNASRRPGQRQRTRLGRLDEQPELVALEFRQDGIAVIGPDRLEPVLRRGLKNDPRILCELPQVRIDAAPQLVGSMIPSLS